MTTSGDSAWRPPEPGAAGPDEQVDGYAELVEIGRGGDSIVYRARELSLNRQVAIKVLLVDDDERALRFAREVEITVDLGRQHPNIVTLLAVATTRSGRPAIVMDYHEGGTLHDRLLSHGPMPVEEVYRVGEVLADALDFAHRRGVLHRDVKPQNVLVLPTSWVLADFGIARLADSEHTSSAETFTYRHAAPQILDGYPPTAADDIWSLGSTLYTLLDGRPPFASDDPHEDSALAYLRRARTAPHRPLTDPAHARIAGVLDRCLAKDVDDRWGTAADLRDALTALRGSAWEPTAGAAAGTTTVTAAQLPPDPVLLPTSSTAPRPALRPVTDPTAGSHTGWRPAAAAPADPTGESPDATARRTPPPADEQAPAPVADPRLPAGWVPGQAPGGDLTPTPAAPTPAPVDLTPPAEPVPVALSVAGRAPVAVDAEATGLGMATGSLPGLAGKPGALDTDGTGDDVTSPRRRLPLILLATALVVGLILGLGGAVLRATGGADDAEQTDAALVEPVPVLPEEPTDPPTLRDQPDPALSFLITDIRADPDGLFLAWRPPDADDVEAYALYQLSPENKLLATLPALSRDYEVPIVPPTGRSCYQMLVFTVDGPYGLAKRRCVTR